MNYVMIVSCLIKMPRMVIVIIIIHFCGVICKYFEICVWICFSACLSIHRLCIGVFLLGNLGNMETWGIYTLTSKILHHHKNTYIASGHSFGSSPQPSLSHVAWVGVGYTFPWAFYYSGSLPSLPRDYHKHPSLVHHSVVFLLTYATSIQINLFVI